MLKLSIGLMLVIRGCRGHISMFTDKKCDLALIH